MIGADMWQNDALRLQKLAKASFNWLSEELTLPQQPSHLPMPACGAADWP